MRRWKKKDNVTETFCSRNYSSLGQYIILYITGRKKSVLIILEAAFNAGWDSLDDKVGRFLSSQGPPINAVGISLSLTMKDLPYTESLTSLKWSNEEVSDGKTLMRRTPSHEHVGDPHSLSNQATVQF